ncbi:MAG: hypothetical protein ABID61_06270 [Candidatus Micrarchaeota archaeon]
MAKINTYRFKKKDDDPLLPIAISNPAPKKYRYKKTDDSHHNVVIISFLLIMVLVFGAVLIFILSQNSSVVPIIPNNTTQPVANLTNGTIVVPVNCTEECLYEQTIAGDSHIPCLSLMNITLSQLCFEHFSNSSIDACKLLDDGEKKKICVTDFAIANKNALLCDLLLTEGQLDCKVQVDSCYSEPNPDYCFALKTNDSSRCDSDDCLLNYSLTKNDATTCNSISIEVISKACTSVLTSNDLCAAFSKDSERDYCYQLFSIYKNDYYSCTQIDNLESPYALDCYSYFAIIQNNLEICDALSLNQRWNCYSIHALATGDLDGCSEIHTLATSSRFTCAFDFALKYGDPAACNVIEDISAKKVCYQGAIIYNATNLDWHNCGDVAMIDWSNKCYNEAAKLANDVSICDMIEIGYARETCKIAYEVNQSKTN